LVQKAARAMQNWIGDRWEEPATITVDLDSIPALAAERDALWARLDATTFLDTEEKRRLAGMEQQA
jgi:phage portal protein BeeE